MTLGFTESKVDSNLCFKVEGERPVILLLCVDTLGMEVWTREVCSKYLEEVQDDECKAMTTPMASNLKLLSVASS